MKYNYIMSVEQISYYVEETSDVYLKKTRLNLTMGNLKTPIDDAVCLTPYSLDNCKKLLNQRPVEFQIREESAIYLTFEKYSDANDDNVEGMAVIDLAELRLGMNALEVPLYKNQKLTSHVNLLLNKIPNLPIVKPDYQP